MASDVNVNAKQAAHNAAKRASRAPVQAHGGAPRRCSEGDDKRSGDRKDGGDGEYPARPTIAVLPHEHLLHPEGKSEANGQP